MDEKGSFIFFLTKTTKAIDKTKPAILNNKKEVAQLGYIDISEKGIMKKHSDSGLIDLGFSNDEEKKEDNDDDKDQQLPIDTLSATIVNESLDSKNNVALFTGHGVVAMVNKSVIGIWETKSD